MSQTLLEMAKDLVLAQIQVHRLSPEDMHAALQDIYSSLLALHAQEASHGIVAVETPETPPAPSNWTKSITKLSARAVTALRKQIVQRSRPWEKAPTYLKAHEQVAQAVAEQTRPAPRKGTARAKK